MVDGKLLSIQVIQKWGDFIHQKRITPQIAIIYIGNDKSSAVYVNIKKKTCEEIGIIVHLHRFDNITLSELFALIKQLNNDIEINGIMVQFPIRPELLPAIDLIDPKKDIDGLTSMTYGSLINKPELSITMAPCTPKGIIRLLDEMGCILEGKNIVIINDSKIVGKPLALMFMNRDATVTVCHRYTTNLIEHTKRADILVVAVGKPGFITQNMVDENAIIIDVGITKIDNKIYGDVDPTIKCAYLTPVPGCVGPLTVSMLIENSVLACLMQL